MSARMLVYIIYDNNRIYGIFSNKEKAFEIAEKCQLSIACREIIN